MFVLAFFSYYADAWDLHSFPTRRSSDLEQIGHRETSGLFPRYMTQMDARHHLDGKLLVALAARWWRASIDRKSTRLNSSHANISYAVFCLKKKKKSTRV